MEISSQDHPEKTDQQNNSKNKKVFKNSGSNPIYTYIYTHTHMYIEQILQMTPPPHPIKKKKKGSLVRA